MAVFVIADLHLSFGTDKPMDVFSGWDNYTERLEKNWRKSVTDSDTVVLAGDISWGMRLEETVADFEYIHSLPGKKIILKGNHDYWWSTKSKIDAFFEKHGFDDMRILHNCAYEADGFVIVGTRGWLYNAKTDEDVKIVNREAGRLKLSIEAGKKLDGQMIAFLHYPPLYEESRCTEILDILEANDIKDCYFGHIHGKYALSRAPAGEYNGIKMNLISCDYVNFNPIKIG